VGAGFVEMCASEGERARRTWCLIPYRLYWSAFRRNQQQRPHERPPQPAASRSCYCADDELMSKQSFAEYLSTREATASSTHRMRSASPTVPAAATRARASSCLAPSAMAASAATQAATSSWRRPLAIRARATARWALASPILSPRGQICISGATPTTICGSRSLSVEVMTQPCARVVMLVWRLGRTRARAVEIFVNLLPFLPSARRKTHGAGGRAAPPCIARRRAAPPPDD